MLSGTCVSLISFHCFHTIRGKSIGAECHLTALKNLSSVIVLFSTNNHVIINFEKGEKRIPEKYLSLYKLCRKNIQDIQTQLSLHSSQKVRNSYKHETNGDLRLRFWRGRNPSCFWVSYPNQDDGLSPRHYLENTYTVRGRHEAIRDRPFFIHSKFF